MTDKFEKTLRSALRPQHPGEDFSARVLAQLDATQKTEKVEKAEVSSTPIARLAVMRQRAFRSPWLPAALAACIVAGFGIFQMQRQAADTARANQARAQLLQALSIASDNVNIVRAAVAREENPDS
jgi:negative regulator of sigma E activity